MNIEVLPSKHALQWAIQYLASYKKIEIVNHEIVAETAYSVVYKIETTQNIIYLKQTPEALFLEPKTLAFLHQQGCKNVPELIAENNELHCFLMSSCGDVSLRHLFNSQVDLKKINQGVFNFTSIQRLLENNVQQLITLGTPDWRLDKLPSLYYQLIQQDNLLIEDGLTVEELDRLHQLYSTCIKLCDALSQYNIPETINHCDFHENNMLLDRKTGDISIIDWGETVISHPFFSLNGCLWNITYFNTIKQADPEYNTIQSQCIEAWKDLHNEEQLLEAFHITNQLNGIFAALGYEQMYIATKEQTITVQHEHPGSIAGCLRSFLNH